MLAGVRRLEAPAVATELIVRPPASSPELAELDRSGVELPGALVDVVATRSSRVGFHWRLFELDGDAEIEAPMFGPNTPMWGGCHAADAPGALWDLATLPSLVQTHRRWLDACFLAWLDEDPNDPYAAPWPNKLPIIEVGDGDMIGLDLTVGPGRGQVVYLCHDDACSVHGRVLGADFVDIITRWSRIGCVGPEGCYLELFARTGSSPRPTHRQCKRGVSGSAWTSPRHRPDTPISPSELHRPTHAGTARLRSSTADPSSSNEPPLEPR